MIRYATLDDLKEIYRFMQAHEELKHVRQDKLKKRILTNHCVFQEGVAITFQTYKRAGKIAVTCPVKAKAGDIILHQIVNGKQFSGAGSRVFQQFVEEIVKPTGGDMYLSVRKANAVACDFYERHGMSVVGEVSWSKGTLPGLIYKLSGASATPCMQRPTVASH